MENTHHIHELIIRLLSGEASPSEKKSIAEWIAQSAENKQLFADLREIWLTTGTLNNTDQYNLEAAINKFRQQVQHEKKRQPKQINFQPYLKYVAIIILALALPFSYYLGTRNTVKSSVTTISCAFGDKSSIALPDSSRVWLNSGSTLTFNSDFKNGGRNVELEGEAFFSVSKDKDHPFRVKTSDLEIKVLGTEFNVKAYSEENSISATLVEGSIEVIGKYQKTFLKPDQKLVFDKENRKMALYELTDTSPETEWKDGRLIFRNESLAELEPKLERWFDVDIVFADEQVKSRRFTGVLERESILEVVSYFDLSNLVECDIKGNKIIIKSETSKVR